MKKDKVFYLIISIISFLLFLTLLTIFGFDKLVSTQNTSQDESMSHIKFLGGFFLGFSFFYSVIPKIPKEQTVDNYIEKKINRIFYKNFSEKIKTNYERLRTIEDEFLDYEFYRYIDIALEISKMNQEWLSQIPLIAFGIIGVWVFISQIPIIDQKFSSGLLFGYISIIIVVVNQALDNFKKWKIMYYDFMLIRSNAEHIQK